MWHQCGSTADGLSSDVSRWWCEEGGPTPPPKGGGEMLAPHVPTDMRQRSDLLDVVLGSVLLGVAQQLMLALSLCNIFLEPGRIREMQLAYFAISPRLLIVFIMKL
ncbi:hypothetical protein EVAR_9450_1 [Eumeta japonica]|uniref:Uncharacterized protein n=1 Tax=Eumeta variegata TaxID=151549 RepID=A0A4C1UEF1_EUMVA|nr:hypothetical protein EVAR_9450_1 [Eumeta japonica]